MVEYRTYHASAPMNAEKREQVLAIMQEAFPPTERRTTEGQRALLLHPLYRVHTVEEDGKILGFMAAWDLQGLTFFEHFAVDSALRGRRIGGEFLDRLLRSEEKPVALEVELPEDELTRRRIAFYERHGLRLNEREYRQLPLRPGDGSTPMYLMSWPDPLKDEDFDHARRDIYRHVYGAEEV